MSLQVNTQDELRPQESRAETPGDACGGYEGHPHMYRRRPAHHHKPLHHLSGEVPLRRLNGEAGHAASMGNAWM